MVSSDVRASDRDTDSGTVVPRTQTYQRNPSRRLFVAQEMFSMFGLLRYLFRDSLESLVMTVKFLSKILRNLKEFLFVLCLRFVIVTYVVDGTLQ